MNTGCFWLDSALAVRRVAQPKMPSVMIATCVAGMGVRPMVTVRVRVRVTVRPMVTVTVTVKRGVRVGVAVRRRGMHTCILYTTVP